jgi:hypothetical protein
MTKQLPRIEIEMCSCCTVINALEVLLYAVDWQSPESKAFKDARKNARKVLKKEKKRANA